MRTLLIAAAVALATAVSATAGGYATVGVSPLPSGDSTTWTPTLTVKAHGVTPVDGAAPVVTIENPATGATMTFPARPTGSPGEYRATVEFPGAGTWEYTVQDGYEGQVHTFPPVEIGAAAAGAATASGPPSTASSGSWAPWLALAVAVTAAAAAVALGLLRRRGRAGAAATAAP